MTHSVHSPPRPRTRRRHIRSIDILRARGARPPSVSVEWRRGRRSKALAKRESGKLVCRARAALKGDASGVAACDAKMDVKFAKAFGNVASGCPGVEATCASMADDCAVQVASSLPGSARLAGEKGSWP
jgi:hypothetical protein